MHKKILESVKPLILALFIFLVLLAVVTGFTYGLNEAFKEEGNSPQRITAKVQEQEGQSINLDIINCPISEIWLGSGSTMDDYTLEIPVNLDDWLKIKPYNVSVSSFSHEPYIIISKDWKFTLVLDEDTDAQIKYHLENHPEQLKIIKFDS